MPDKQDLVIFSRGFELVAWLLPQAERLPKAQRFLVTQRLVAAALDFSERLHEANAHQGSRRLACLEAADGQLDKLRMYLRLVHHMGWLAAGPYGHASRMVAGIGRLLGGWLKQTRATISASAEGAGRRPADERR